MRRPVTAAHVEEFMKALGRGVTVPARIFFVGGATAVLLGWRDSTIDIDLKTIPDRERFCTTIFTLKRSRRLSEVTTAI